MMSYITVEHSEHLIPYLSNTAQMELKATVCNFILLIFSKNMFLVETCSTTTILLYSGTLKANFNHFCLISIFCICYLL